MILDRNISIAIKHTLNKRFGADVCDISYDIESHELLFWDKIEELGRLDAEALEAIRDLYKTIDDYIQKEFGYKKSLFIEDINPDDMSLETKWAYKLTKEQEDILFGYARIINGTIN